MDKKQYSVYKKDEEIVFGTLEEIASKLDVHVNTVKFYATPSYIKRTSKLARRLVCVSWYLK